MRRLVAVLLSRCPRCLEGHVWHSFFVINERCPVCALVFEREPGYWTGAMVASYALGVPLLVLIFLAIWLVSGLDVLPALVSADVVFLAATPFVWRYSRVVWLHFDWLLDPVR